MVDENAPPPPPPAESKVAPEMAEHEFDRFADCMDLDTDVTVMDTDDRSQFDKLKRRVVVAITNGSLIINDNGEAVYTAQKSPIDTPLVFHERTGASSMAMDGKKKNHDMAKTYAVMANMTKVHPGVISQLKGIDIKVCEAVFLLLMD